MTQNYKLNGEDYIKYESTDLDFIAERDLLKMVYRYLTAEPDKLEAIRKAFPTDRQIEKLRESGTYYSQGYADAKKEYKTIIQNILDK